MSLPIEYRYEVITALIGGVVYLGLGVCMALLPARWPDFAFVLLPGTRRRISHIALESKPLRFIRILGICFALLALTMLQHGIQHYRWIKHIEELGA